MFDLHDCYDTIKNKAQKAQSAARAQALAVSGSPEAAHAALQVVGMSLDHFLRCNMVYISLFET